MNRGVLEKDIPHFLAKSDILAKRINGVPQLQLQCIGGALMNEKNKHVKMIICKNIVDTNSEVKWEFITPSIDDIAICNNITIEFESIEKSGNKYFYPKSGVVKYHLDYRYPFIIKTIDIMGFFCIGVCIIGIILTLI